MFVRSSRALILTAIVTVIAYAQCFSDCGFRPCETEQTAPASCHHEAPATQQPEACSHQHSDFSSPEARMENNASPLLFVLETAWQVPLPMSGEVLRRTPNTSPPGETFVSSPAILRI